MRKHVLGVDHLIILVRDLDAAAADFAALGFTLSPRGVHSAHMGTGNNTIMLERDYFELLAVLSPTDANAKWRELVARREGMSAVALKTDDATAAAAEMRGTGVDVADPVQFSRPVALPGGQSGIAAFNTCQFPPEATPALRMFCCQHLTQATTWVPSLLAHANTATGLDAVLVVARDPAALAAPYARLFDRGATELPDGIAVATGNTPILFLTRAAIAARYPGVDLAGLPEEGLAGFVIRVRDGAAAKTAVGAAGVAIGRAGAIAIPPARARGALIELRPG